MNGQDEEPTILKDSWQEGIAEDARASGFIALDHLGFILAKDEQYIENIPYLWEHYELNKRGPAEPDISTPKARVGVWIDILYRWAFGTVAGSTAGLKVMRRMEVHSVNEKAGKLEEYIPGDIAYVTLEEIEEYFTKVVEIPLPRLLFLPKKEGVPEVPAEGQQDKGAIDYGFFREGPTWTIIFAGKRIYGLKGKGFSEIYHLVQNENKEIPAPELMALDGVVLEGVPKDVVDPVDICNLKEDLPEEWSTFDEKDQAEKRAVVRAESAFDVDSAVSNTDFVALSKEKEKLEAERKKAEDQGNFERVAELEDDIKAINKYGVELYFEKNRRLKPEIKKITDRVGKRIRWAIDKISERDPDAGTHFQKSIKPSAYKLVYRPENPVRWTF
jgi:hypothetical protein